MPRQEKVQIGQGVQIVEFPDNYTDQQVEDALRQFIIQGIDTPEDMPPMAPEGATFQQTEPKGWMERLGEDIPAIVGGMAGPLAASGKVAQMAPMAGRATLAGMAALGGAAGEAYATLYRSLVGDKETPETSAEVAKRLAGVGVEQGLYEVGGQTVIAGLKALAKPLAPLIKEETKLLGQEFGKYGGYFTIPQMAENRWIKTVGGLVEKSFTGSPFFKKAAERNRVALDAMADDLAEQITKASFGNLSDKQVGQLFLDTASKGRVAHSSIANTLYSELDNLVGERVVQQVTQKTVPTPFISPTGQHIEKVITESIEVLRDNAPVNMTPMKRKAAEMLTKMERTGTIGGDESKRILTTLASRPDKMLFSDANTIRSELLAVTREMEEKLGAGKAKAIAIEFAQMATDAMKRAAIDSGDPALLKSYERANKFWAHGKEIFDNKFIGKLITQNKVNASRIGETIFRDGNVEEIVQARKAIKTAAKLDKNINADEVWKEMQSGYLRSVLAKSTNAGEEIVDFRLLSKVFVDPKKSRTLATVFTPEQRRTINAFLQTAKRVEEHPESQLSMVMQLSQAGALGGLMVMKVVDPTTTAAITIGPAVISRMLTNPETSKTLVMSMNTRQGTTLGKQLTTKLIAEASKLMTEEVKDEEATK